MVKNILFQVCILGMVLVMVLVMVGCVSAQVTTFDRDNMIKTIASTSYPIGVAVNSLGETLITGFDQRVLKVLLNGTINSIAGTGVIGYNGDGILATSAHLYTPHGIAVNSLGEVIIADTYNLRVRKILLNGTIITIAGTGDYGYNGDGILATDANLQPIGIAVNSLDEVLIVDSYNQRVRKILLNGTITTIAGTGVDGYNGDNILAISAHLSNPDGIAVNSLGEILIADTDNSRVRKILLNGTIITIAGTGIFDYNGDNILATSAHLNYPRYVVENSLGEVLISEYGRVRKILLNGTITTIAGTDVVGYNGDDIVATSAHLHFPHGIAVSSLDEVLIADTNNHRVRKLVLACPDNSIKSGPNQCTCLVGYFGYGQYCNKFNCNNVVNDRSDVCSSNGQCVSPNNCTCNKNGYYGANCELYNCNNIPFNDTRVCSSFGKCITPNNCTCKTGYLGSNCELYKCFGIPKDSGLVCSGIGECKGLDLCECPKTSSNSAYNKDCSQLPINGTNRVLQWFHHYLFFLLLLSYSL